MDSYSEDLFPRAFETFKTQDSFAVIEWLHRGEDPITVMKAYRDLVFNLYWKEKNLPSVVTLALAGIQYGLTFGLDQGSAELTYDLKSLAKTLAYNLSSFTWPGWDEPGITIGPTAVAVGLETSGLNLRLAEDLNKGDLSLTRGHWMRGAHHLAQGNTEQAIHHFKESVKYAKLAESPGEIWLAHGFAKLAVLRASPDNAAARAELQGIRARLNEVENGKEFGGQIEIAAKVFQIRVD